MSHDRGCWKCGAERWEYDSCQDKDCAKRPTQKTATLSIDGVQLQPGDKILISGTRAMDGVHEIKGTHANLLILDDLTATIQNIGEKLRNIPLLTDTWVSNGKGTRLGALAVFQGAQSNRFIIETLPYQVPAFEIGETLHLHHDGHPLRFKDDYGEESAELILRGYGTTRENPERYYQLLVHLRETEIDLTEELK